MTTLRTAAQQALEALKDYKRSDDDRVSIAMHILHAALEEPQQDPELSAALDWVAGISEPLLDRKALLRRVDEVAQAAQDKTKRAWDVGYDCGIRAAAEFAAERRLTDTEIGQLWFEAKLPGVTETQARRLIRAAEKMMRGEIR